MPSLFRRKKNTFQSALVRKHRVSHELRKKRKRFVRTKLFLSNIRTKFLAEYKYIIAGVAFILLVGGTVGLVFFSHYFDIAYLVVERSGLETNTIPIEQKLQPYLKKNILLVDPAEIRSQVLSSFPELQEVLVSRLLPRTIKVQVAEYELKARVKTPASPDQLFINEIGMLRNLKFKNESLPLIEYHNQYDIKDEKMLKVLSGFLAFQDRNIIMDRQELAVILQTRSDFEREFSLKVPLVEFYPLERELHLHTEKGFTVWIDLADNVPEQMQKLKAAQQDFNIYTIELSYIDLRIKHKIIYCSKNSACTPKAAK